MYKRSVCLAILPLFLGTSCQCGEKPGENSTDVHLYYTFPAEGVDHLEMKVTLDVDIPGIGTGKDTVQLAGTVVVHRSGPSGVDGKTMDGALVGASFRGVSDVFRPVLGCQSPIRNSPCRVHL
jgi:hypothetical protein